MLIVNGAIAFEMQLSMVVHVFTAIILHFFRLSQTCKEWWCEPTIKWRHSIGPMALRIITDYTQIVDQIVTHFTHAWKKKRKNKLFWNKWITIKLHSLAHTRREKEYKQQYLNFDVFQRFSFKIASNQFKCSTYALAMTKRHPDK